MTMTSRERVLATIHHELPDRVPIVLGVSNATGMKMKPYRELKELLGISAPDEYIYGWPELGTAAIDEATMIRLHSDVRGVLDLEPGSVRERNRQREPHSPFVDSWGSGQTELSPGVWFPGVHPLADASTIDEIEAYDGWPDMNDPSRLAHVRKLAQQLHDENQYALFATPWLLFPFERAHAMQGLENFMIHMVNNQDFASAMLRKITDHCLVLMDNFLRECGDVIDIIKIGDDLGTQSGLMISPKMYRQYLKPLHAEFVSFIKERTDAKVFFHTDGDVMDLVEDFVEIGIDILNPIQTSAGRMSDLPQLKRRYGDNMVFCGAIDTHRLLPYGTPAEVRQEVKRVMDILGQGGGYMVASVHTIMNDVPAQNILAMVDAVEEFGQYPLST
ncbi:MAG: hypothetical protein GY759_14230 [Chloroflexi bacterium]|nr:hypothetical protein [Chloroflexota bacterium]